MNRPDSDDDLRERFRELREVETARPPAFERIRQGAFSDAPGGVSWMHPGWAWAVAALFVLAGSWWLLERGNEAGAPPPRVIAEVEMREAPDLDFPIEDEWTTATDGLLAEAESGAATAQVERLTHEIAVLLQP